MRKRHSRTGVPDTTSLTFDEIVKTSQEALKRALTGELTRRGYKATSRPGFLYAKGDAPVMLMAHMDTVHNTPVKTICRSDDGNIIMSPEGIGGDDRAGVYMILRIIERCRCHVLFCEDEEIGGVGAREFTRSGITPDVNYIVELDRRGDNDAVFYDCANPEFTEFVTSFGFSGAAGTFSDISIVAPSLKVAAVNISAGYYNEHTRYEHVDMEAIERNIKRVGEMVSAKSPMFRYVESRLKGCRFNDWYQRDCMYYMYNKSSAIDNDVNCKLLVQLPFDEQENPNEAYYMDKYGDVYEYFYELDAMVLKGYDPSWRYAVEFDPENAQMYEITTQDEVVDMMMWDEDEDEFDYDENEL